MDVVRILVRTKSNMSLNKPFNVDINENTYQIKIVEDTSVSLQIIMSKKLNSESRSDNDSDEDEHGDPLAYHLSETPETFILTPYSPTRKIIK